MDKETRAREHNGTHTALAVTVTVSYWRHAWELGGWLTAKGIDQPFEKTLHVVSLQIFDVDISVTVTNKETTCMAARVRVLRPTNVFYLNSFPRLG